MPAVPKPSRKTKDSILHPRKDHPKIRTAKTSEPRKEKKEYSIPTKGKTGLWLTAIRASGGITRQGLVDGCIANGLALTMHTAMARYCKRMNLLLESNHGFK